MSSIPGPAASRSSFSRRVLLRSAAATTLAAAGVGAYTRFVEPYWFRVFRQTMHLRGLAPAWVGRRIVHLSDLHVGPTDSGFLARALDHVDRHLAPDLAVYTGDFVSNPARQTLAEVRRLLAGRHKSARAVLACLGNHDYGPGWQQADRADRLQAMLQDVGVQMLRNEWVEVDGLRVVGLDDLWARRFDPACLAASDVGVDAIALCHNPDACDRPGWEPFRGWVLAGHTHGGQCKPPFLPPPLLPVSNRRYVGGEYRLDDRRTLYINRALGHLRPVRFNCRPEITLFELAST